MNVYPIGASVHGSRSVYGGSHFSQVCMMQLL